MLNRLEKDTLFQISSVAYSISMITLNSAESWNFSSQTYRMLLGGTLLIIVQTSDISDTLNRNTLTIFAKFLFNLLH